MRRSKVLGELCYWNYMFILFIWLLPLSTAFDELRTDERFAVKLKESAKEAVFDGLQKHNFSILFEITPTTYILKYTGGRNNGTQRILQDLLHIYKDKVISMEEVTVYENILKPEAVFPPYTFVPEPKQEIDNHYGMGVSKAHALGYTGRGVVVAITDVGVHTDLLDLSENIERNLSYNFINNSRDVTPEYFHNLQDTSASFIAHGDHCASIIASVRGNGICTFGIAFKAKIVGLKIYMVALHNERSFDLEPAYSTRSDIIARGLIHRLSQIDIFSNAWAPTKPFTSLDLPTKDAIIYGAEKGRHGFGTIYVVPAGLAGNGFANSIHTIAVKGVGRNWYIPDDSSVSACVITSGLSGGSNITASHMFTASQKNRCVSTFNGDSAATAQIAAIIALALEANPTLTLRQLKHLLVDASGPDENGNGFSPNAAGHYFHKVYGFGLLDAAKLVLLAKNNRKLLPLLQRSMNEVSMRIEGSAQDVEFCYYCDVYKIDTCLDTVEDVVVNMSLTNYCKHLGMVLVSPSGTESVLLDFTTKLTTFRDKKIELTSVHFLDEEPFGTWRLKLIYPANSCGDQTSVHTMSLMLYGTKTRTLDEQQPRLKHGNCARLRNDKYTTRRFTTISTESRVSVATETDLPFVVIVICVIIVGTIVILIFRLQQRCNYLRLKELGKFKNRCVH